MDYNLSQPGRPVSCRRAEASPQATGHRRLYVTTNYDDLLETALAKRATWVVVDRGQRGRSVFCMSGSRLSNKARRYGS